MRVSFVLLVELVVLLAATTTAVVNAWKPPCLFRPFVIAGRVATATTAAAAGAATVGAAAGLAVYLQQQQSKKQNELLYTPEPNSLTGQTILITGGTTGLGLESAKRLAIGNPTQLIITARSDSKGEAAVKQVQDYLAKEQQNDSNTTSTNTTAISYKLLDLDDLQSIRESVESWNDISKIDVLLNNAGIMALPERQVTIDGFEQQIQSNHLGHFMLTALLSKSSMIANDARIINVASEAHKFASKGLDFTYMWKAEDKYGAWRSYGQSKLANIMFTQELQRRVDNSTSGINWTVVTLHPGTVGTDLGRHLFGEDQYQKLKDGNGSILQTTVAKTANVFLKTPQQGATSQIWLASRGDEKDTDTDAAAVGDVRGQYIIDCQVRELSDIAKDENQAARLWKESEELTGVAFDL